MSATASLRFSALAPAACLLVLLAAACARPSIPHHDEALPAVRLAVPYVAARPGDCGPAALVMVLGHYGRTLNEAEAERLVVGPGGGTTTLDLVHGARALGMQAESAKGDFAVLRARLDAGRPPVVLVDYGRLYVRVPHFLVLVGYGSDQAGGYFLGHGPDRAYQRVSEADLAAVWDKTGRVTVFIQPKTEPS